MTPKVFFLCGHESWGKSKTLYYLARESTRRGWIVVNDLDVFVKHMSNDDIPEDYVYFMLNLDPARKPFVVAALCPDFVNPAKETKKIITSLMTKGYKLFFWVMLHQHITDNKMKPEDIEELRPFGEVSLYDKKAEAKQRSKDFLAYIFERSTV